MPVTIVTFSTPEYDHVYNRHAGASCVKLGLTPHRHYRCSSSGDWARNTHRKSDAVYSALVDCGPVLYIDSDADIMSDIVMGIDDIVPKEYSAAQVFLDHGAWYGGDSSVVEPLTGTLFVRPSFSGIVSYWQSLCMDNPSTPDGDLWTKAISCRADEVFHLPIEWCYIASRPDGRPGGIPCEQPYIVHNQASRRMKYEVRKMR